MYHNSIKETKPHAGHRQPEAEQPSRREQPRPHLRKSRESHDLPIIDHNLPVGKAGSRRLCEMSAAQVPLNHMGTFCRIFYRNGRDFLVQFPVQFPIER